MIILQIRKLLLSIGLQQFFLALFPCILFPGYQTAAAPFGENGYF